MSGAGHVLLLDARHCLATSVGLLPPFAASATTSHGGRLGVSIRRARLIVIEGRLRRASDWRNLWLSLP